MSINARIAEAFKQMFTGWDECSSYYSQGNGRYYVRLSIDEGRLQRLSGPEEYGELLSRLVQKPLQLTGRVRPLVGRYRMGGGIRPSEPNPASQPVFFYPAGGRF